MPRDSELHAMLLRLAGRIPDDLLAKCREWAAAGRGGDVAAAVAFAVVWREATMDADDIELLADLTEAAGGDPADLPEIEATEDEPPMYFEFLPVRELDEVTPQQIAAMQAASVEDAVDRAAVDAVAAEAGVRGLWRVWRHPALRSPWPAPRRVYVVEVDDDAAFVPLTASIQLRLAAAGEADPQVEVVPTGVEIPAYQSNARAYGGLLWASTPEPELRVADPFDEVTEEGEPVFHPDHPRIDDPVERRRILHYLRLGEEALVTQGLMDDVVEPTRRQVVPLSLRTDGQWIWLDATAYYLEEHHLAPSDEFLAHIRAADYAMPEVDGVAVHRAVGYLLAIDATGEDGAEDADYEDADDYEDYDDEDDYDYDDEDEDEDDEDDYEDEEDEVAEEVIAEAAEVVASAEAEVAEEVAEADEHEELDPIAAALKGLTPVKNIATIEVTAGGPTAPVL